MYIRKKVMPLIDTTTDLISSLGFPIACAVAVAYVFYSFLKSYQNEKAKQGKSKKIPYMMNRELSWLKFNERVLHTTPSNSFFKA